MGKRSKEESAWEKKKEIEGFPEGHKIFCLLLCAPQKVLQKYSTIIKFNFLTVIHNLV